MRAILWGGVAAVVAAAAAPGLCAGGLLTSLHDRFVCCPKSCGGCDEVQCQRRVARCCPAQLYRAGRACAGAGDSGCVFRRDAAAAAPAAAGGARVAGFCAAGARGNERGVVADAKPGERL